MSLLTPEETGCLEMVRELFSGWNYNDWCFVNEYAFKLLDYDVEIYEEDRKRYDILVNRNTMPWGPNPKAIRWTVPGGEYEGDYEEVIKYLENKNLALKFVPADKEALENLSMEYNFNGNIIKVGIPSKTVEEFQKEIEREGYDSKKLTEHNIKQWTAKIESFKIAGEKKEDNELVEACERCINLLNTL